MHTIIGMFENGENEQQTERKSGLLSVTRQHKMVNHACDVSKIIEIIYIISTFRNTWNGILNTANAGTVEAHQREGRDSVSIILHHSFPSARPLVTFMRVCHVQTTE